MDDFSKSTKWYKPLWNNALQLTKSTTKPCTINLKKKKKKCVQFGEKRVEEISRFWKIWEKKKKHKLIFMKLNNCVRVKKSYSFIQRIKLIYIENVTPHACFASLMIHRWNVNRTKIIEIFHKHLQQQQYCNVWKCHAKHFVCNHQNNMK